MSIDHLLFNPETRLFPIIGSPMGQSSAAYAYNPLFAANGVNEIMWPVEVPAGGLADFLKAARTLGIRHFTLTMPHKSAIIPLLDEVDETSLRFNSVNIVKFEGGRSIGAGMDGKGNIAAIRRAGVDVSGMRVAILGAGAIAGVIILELARAGAKSVTVLNRSAANALSLKERVGEHVDIPIDCRPMTPENLGNAAAECDFLMQSTPQGMKGYPAEWESLAFMERLRPGTVVMENIVNPPGTAFAQKAAALGLPVIYGLDMMLGEIGAIFEFCYGRYPAPEHMAAARDSIYRFFDFQK